MPSARVPEGAPLRLAPCRTLCAWGPTRVSVGGHRLFACTGCGAQWTRGEPWTPRQLDGSWPPGVREELTGEEPSAESVSTGPAGGAAGSAGS